MLSVICLSSAYGNLFIKGREYNATGFVDDATMIVCGETGVQYQVSAANFRVLTDGKIQLPFIGDAIAAAETAPETAAEDVSDYDRGYLDGCREATEKARLEFAQRIETLTASRERTTEKVEALLKAIADTLAPTMTAPSFADALPPSSIGNRSSSDPFVHETAFLRYWRAHDYLTFAQAHKSFSEMSNTISG